MKQLASEHKMPPKKKKKGGKKKKKEDGELTADDMYKKTLGEVEALKDHLAMRRELVRRAQTTGDTFRSQREDSQKKLLEQEDSQKAVSAEMTRQYKTMQTELSLRVHTLETELQRTRLQLDETERELKKTKAEKESIVKQKDSDIERLENNIKNMGENFLQYFLDTMEKLKENIDGEAKGRWAERATSVQASTKQTLLEFGLHPLDI